MILNGPSSTASPPVTILIWLSSAPQARRMFAGLLLSCLPLLALLLLLLLLLR